MDKQILVVKRDVFDSVGVDTSLSEEDIIELLDKHGMPMQRAQAETDTNYKQIIPYCVIWRKTKDGNEVLCYRRKSGGNEDRLHGLVSFGVGGHVKWKDNIGPFHMCWDTVWQELKEETGLEFGHVHDIGFRGVINLGTQNKSGETVDVNDVHLGLWYNISLVSPNQEIKNLEPEKMEFFWAGSQDLADIVINLKKSFSLETATFTKSNLKLEAWSRAILPYVLYDTLCGSFTSVQKI